MRKNKDIKWDVKNKDRKWDAKEKYRKWYVEKREGGTTLFLTRVKYQNLEIL